MSQDLVREVVKQFPNDTGRQPYDRKGRLLVMCCMPLCFHGAVFFWQNSFNYIISAVCVSDLDLILLASAICPEKNLSVHQSFSLSFSKK
jgi:hypothetical protein